MIVLIVLIAIPVVVISELVVDILSSCSDFYSWHCLVKERAVPCSVVHGVPETAQQDHRAEFN